MNVHQLFSNLDRTKYRQSLLFRWPWSGLEDGWLSEYSNIQAELRSSVNTT